MHFLERKHVNFDSYFTEVCQRVKWTIFQHWIKQWHGTDQATSHYLNQWWEVYWRIYGSLGFNGSIRNGVPLSFPITRQKIKQNKNTSNAEWKYIRIPITSSIVRNLMQDQPRGPTWIHQLLFNFLYLVVCLRFHLGISNWNIHINLDIWRCSERFRRQNIDLKVMLLIGQFVTTF